MKVLGIVGRPGLSELALREELARRLGQTLRIVEYPYARPGDKVRLADHLDGFSPDVVWLDDLDRRYWSFEGLSVPVVATFYEPMRGVNAWTPEYAPCVNRVLLSAWATEAEFCTDTPSHVERFDPWFPGTREQSRACGPASVQRDIDVAFVGDMDAPQLQLRRAFYQAVAERLRGVATHYFGLGSPRHTYSRARVALIASGEPNEPLEDIPLQLIEAGGYGCDVITQALPSYVGDDIPSRSTIEYEPGEVETAARLTIAAVKSKTRIERARCLWQAIQRKFTVESATDRLITACEEASKEAPSLSPDRRLYCTARALIGLGTASGQWSLAGVMREAVKPLREARLLLGRVKDEDVESKARFLSAILDVTLGNAGPSGLKRAVDDFQSDPLAGELADVADVLMGGKKIALYQARTTTQDRHFELLGRLLIFAGGLTVRNAR